MAAGHGLPAAGVRWQLIGQRDSCRRLIATAAAETGARGVPSGLAVRG
jgi:hypothetical protein